MSCRAVRQEMMLCVNVPGGDISGYAATTDWQVFPFAEPVMADRVRAMISLAHPAFRDQLTEEAKAHHLIP